MKILKRTISSDTTGSAAIKDRLRQTQKMEAIGRLAGSVAHDFNNLLVGILGYSEILTHKLDCSHPLRPKAEEIRKAALLARELTAKLLAFSRNEVLRPEVVDICEVLRNIENLLRITLGEDKKLILRISSQDLFVKIDRAQFEEVLINLTVNARDAMHAGGVLTIELGRQETHPLSEIPPPSDPPRLWVSILVSDTGAGIAPEVLPHIFEPFFTTKGPGRGTGLGLANVYAFVKQSCGHIHVRPANNCGTTFAIFLPVTGEVPPQRNFKPLQLPPSLGETILLVEDDNAVRHLSLEILESAGYHVAFASNGKQALEIAQNFGLQFQLLLTDIVMPGMLGQDLAIELSRKMGNLKVLFFSGYMDSPALLDACEQLGFGWSYLQKPFLPNQLLAQVRKMIDPRVGSQ
jgi:nitrogen-specific signal transduction histidine kinase/CheY-like chemotaxis protein